MEVLRHTANLFFMDDFLAYFQYLFLTEQRQSCETLFISSCYFTPGHYLVSMQNMFFYVLGWELIISV